MRALEHRITSLDGPGPRVRNLAGILPRKIEDRPVGLDCVSGDLRYWHSPFLSKDDDPTQLTA